MQKNNKLKNVKFILGNANKIKFQKADLIVAYYSMQFIRPSDRQKLFNKIFKALNWGGAFIMFEKVRPEMQDFKI